MGKKRTRQANSAKTSHDAESVSPRPSEQLLIDAIAGFPAEQVFCTSLGRAEFAHRYAEHFADAQVKCLFLDIAESTRAETVAEALPKNLRILCDTDPPAEELDLAVMPVTQGGEAELTRDLMQSAHERLRIGGRLVVAIDNARDTFMNGEMQRLFDKVTVQAEKGGVIYAGTKREPLKKLKDFSSEFKFRDGERLLTVMTRPGVVNHRHLDVAARALMEVLQIAPGDRVLDLGAGAGVLSLAAAVRAPDVSVLAIDSNARAIQCTTQNAKANGIESITTKLNATAKVDDFGTFDVAVANTPDNCSFRLAEILLKGARRALRSGGEFYLATKNSEWYEENMPKQFSNVRAIPSRGYAIMRGNTR